MSSAKDVTDASFEADVLKSDKPIMVDFWAEWCGPCRAVSPILDKIAEENADKLKAVEIDNGAGCVAPSSDTARDGSYAPLARPLFVYVDKKAFTSNAALKGFMNFFVENESTIAEAAQYIPLSDEQKKTAQDELAALG